MGLRPLIESQGSPGRVPAAQGHQRPNGFDHAERPGALKKPVKRTETTRAGESQDEPRAALLEGVADQHRRHRKQAEGRKTVHLSTHTSAAFGISRRPLARDRRPDAKKTRGSMIFLLAGSERNRLARKCRALGRVRSDSQSARSCGAPLVARERVFEAVLTLIIAAKDFRPRRHHENLLMVAKPLGCCREMCRDRQIQVFQAADLVDNPAVEERN